MAEKQIYASHYFETALDLTVCVKDAQRPGFYIITVKGSKQAGLTGLKGGIVRKVAATDFGEGSLRAFPHAISFANHLRAKLIFLHVVPVAPVPEHPSRDVLLMRDAARMACLRRLEQLLTNEEELALPPEYLVHFARPSERILQLALKLKADLIFMGLRRSTHFPAAPQTHWATAYEIVCGASCPVLTVRTQ